MTSKSGEGIITPLFHDVELFMPVNKLKIPQNFNCKIDDILSICELIDNGHITEPIIVNEENIIIDGKKRFYAFKRLGHQRVKVIRKGNVTQSIDFQNEFEIIKFHNN